MCEICDRIAAIRANQNPCFVRELETGYLVLGDHQYFKGYSLFLCKRCVKELHDLDFDFRSQHLMEMSVVSEAVALAFNADKMNIESLGNGISHLHWHLFPRRLGDSPSKGPVWWVSKEAMYDPSRAISAAELADYSNRLNAALNQGLAQLSEAARKQ